MVVYHYNINDGQFPAACMAMTAHPGTAQTIVNSRTFAEWESGNIRTDFFNGHGTNGWEFTWPSTFDDAGGFANQIASSAPLGIALRNLAYFAGDPEGGAPSFHPVQDTVAADSTAVPHPYPYLLMWGDFSPLRRIFEESLDRSPNPVAYRDLSPADQATLHSAACTLSMLAYNIQEEVGDADLSRELDEFLGNFQSEF
jgi:hypothetical protein